MELKRALRGGIIFTALRADALHRDMLLIALCSTGGAAAWPFSGPPGLPQTDAAAPALPGPAL